MNVKNNLSDLLLSLEKIDLNNPDRNEILFQIAKTYQLEGNIKQAMDYYMACIENIQSLSQMEMLAKANTNLGVIYLAARNYSASKEAFSKSLDIKIQYQLGDLIPSYINLGSIYILIEEHPEALRCFEKAKQMAIEQHDVKAYLKCIYNQGAIYYNLDNFETALKYLELLVGYSDQLDIDLKVKFQVLLAGCYLKMDRTQDAKLLLDQTLCLAEESSYVLGLLITYTILVEYYIIEAMYFQARDLCQTILSIKESKNTDKELSSLYSMFQINNLEQNNQNTEENLQQIFLLANKLENKDIYRLALKQGSIFYLLIKEYKKAHDMLSEYTELKEEFYSRRVDSQLSTIEFEQELDTKRREMEWERQKNIELDLEKKKSEEILKNILPEETIEELKEFGRAITKRHESVTVMFFDVKQFSKLAEHLPPDSLILILDYYFSKFDEIITKYSDIEKIKTIGDCYMCVSGLHDRDELHAINAVNAACDIMEFVEYSQEEVLKKFQYSFNFRGGIHSGSLVSGVVGSHKYAYDVWGNTVNIASRMESSGEVGKINISEATYELVRKKFVCSYRGKVEVKNQVALDMYFVENKHEI